jgi:hypothetical protein
MLRPDAKEFVPYNGTAVYGDAPDSDDELVIIGGNDMLVGGYGEYSINKIIIEEKYNPGKLFEKYAGHSYITESIVISHILKEKPKNIDPFWIALTKLSNTIDNINNICASAKISKTCESSPESSKPESFWKQIGRCPCKVISFIILSKKDIDDMVNEIDLNVLYRFARAIIAYASVYEEGSSTLQDIPSPPIIELSSAIVEIDSDDGILKDQIIEINNSAKKNIKQIERYRDIIAGFFDKSATLLNTVFNIK